MSRKVVPTDFMDELNQYRDFRRTRRCTPKVKENEKSSDSCELSSEDSPDNNHSSDEDFSLNMKRKKPKKKKKKIEPEKKTRLPKQKSAIIPSFDQVMEAQCQHAQKFINFDEYEYESEGEQIEEDDPISNDPSSEDEAPPIVHKRRKVVIHPWNPIGITGGRRTNNV